MPQNIFVLLTVSCLLFQIFFSVFYSSAIFRENSQYSQNQLKLNALKTSQQTSLVELTDILKSTNILPASPPNYSSIKQSIIIP